MTKKDFELLALVLQRAMVSFANSGKVLSDDKVDVITDFFANYLLKAMVISFELAYENFDSEKFVNATLPDDSD